MPLMMRCIENSLRGSTSTSFPSRMIVARSEMRSTSFKWCDTNTIDFPRFRRFSIISSSLLPSFSVRHAVGSSNIRISAPNAIARAICTSCWFATDILLTVCFTSMLIPSSSSASFASLNIAAQSMMGTTLFFILRTPRKMFSATVSSGIRLISCGTIAMPFLSAICGVSMIIFSPSR
ncbi:MAG: hypothetical protein BWY81_00020 [Firmicutes bacterium ADurb.Bin467]|nr:MAG: hypothetical protein BWY81_00020 [Firmicutes bacterium ADurb.Bin467]